MAKDVIVACDFPNGEELEAFLEKMPRDVFIKIGLELYLREGRGLVRALKERGYRIFLDLKLHDIPNTVGRSVANLRELAPDFLTLHTTGGRDMMAAAARDAGDMGLLGVTVLTSLSDEMRKGELHLGEGFSTEDYVVHLAGLALEEGIRGIVASPLEGRALRRALGHDFDLVCPGIRPVKKEGDDQARTMTPKEAREAGVDYIVVGRPITQAADPKAAYLEILAEFLGE
ncbi:MAG: orotidine-5'-phosphate decarboxylase [Tissierellia bacterium]|nr:orotidine-5'-phosphate decarboxylase [Tissierellia bacterium]